MSLKAFEIILILSLFCLSYQFFDKDTKVIQLNKENFKKEVTESEGLWLILFYAPWCGHCKRFHPEFEKIAKVTKGLFKIGAVNCEEEKDLAKKYKIDGFPTVLFFGENKEKTEEYEGDREAVKVLDFLFEKAKKITNDKLKNVNKNPKKKKEVKTDL